MRFYIYRVDSQNRKVLAKVGRGPVSQNEACRYFRVLHEVDDYSPPEPETAKGRCVATSPNGGVESVARAAGRSDFITYQVWLGDPCAASRYDTYQEAVEALWSAGYKIDRHYRDGSETWDNGYGELAALETVARPEETTTAPPALFLVQVSIGSDDWPVAIFGDYSEAERFAVVNYTALPEPTIPQALQDVMGYVVGSDYHHTTIVEFRDGRPVSRTVVD